MFKSNIEWTEYVNNTITGCLKNCPYCYARDIAENPRFKKGFPNGFKLTFHPDKVMAPAKHKKPQLVFADSMSDFFGEGVKEEWINQSLMGMKEANQHIFQILTKCPENIKNIPEEYRKLNNVWVGVSIDNNKTSKHRLETLERNLENTSWHKFISFEPVLDEPRPDLEELIKSYEWIIIGQRTKSFNNPPIKWIKEIIRAAQANDIPIFIKNNLYERKDKDGLSYKYQIEDNYYLGYRKFPEHMEIIRRRD